MGQRGHREDVGGHREIEVIHGDQSGKDCTSDPAVQMLQMGTLPLL